MTSFATLKGRFLSPQHRSPLPRLCVEACWCYPTKPHRGAAAFYKSNCRHTDTVCPAFPCNPKTGTTHMYTRTCIYTDKHTQALMHRSSIHVCVHLHKHACTQTDACAHAQTHAHTHTHTHTYARQSSVQIQPP